MASKSSKDFYWKKIIFGFVGELASGKGTGCSYISEKFSATGAASCATNASGAGHTGGAAIFRFSTVLRDLLKRLNIPETRENMVKLSESIRQNFGEDALAASLAEDIKHSGAKIIAVDGIRRQADILYLKNLHGFVLVEIYADPEKRFERIKKRRENPDDAAKTWEEFLKDSKRPTEITIREVTKNASEHIDNNGDLNSLHSQLDNLINKYAR